MLHRSTGFFIKDIREIERIVTNDVYFVVLPNMEHLASRKHLFCHITVFYFNKRIALLDEYGLFAFLMTREDIHCTNV